jgi:hypothetical protein
MHCVASSRGAIDADPAPGAIAPRVEEMHCVASSRGAIDADPAPGAIAPRVEETGVGHGPG